MNLEGYAPAMAQSILVADDHQEMRQLVVELLSSRGFEVREVADTNGVMDELARERPDLLIMDIHMPGAGGVEALRSIRANPRYRGLPVLILSGSVELTEAWTDEIEADATLPKPFPIDELHSTVQALLAG
jgi:CheY-like chemotaxis protein